MKSSNDFIAVGASERLIEAGHWQASSLGPRKRCPDCLSAATDILRPAQARIVLFWGEEFVALYNEAYTPAIGDKHPRAFGRPARENWGELWNDLEPCFDVSLTAERRSLRRTVPSTSNATATRKQVHFDISHSPVRDEERRVRGSLQRQRNNRPGELRECIAGERRSTEGDFFAVRRRDRSDRLHEPLSPGNNRFCEILGYRESEAVIDASAGYLCCQRHFRGRPAL